jgi:hypothetical protein
MSRLMGTRRDAAAGRPYADGSAGRPARAAVSAAMARCMRCSGTHLQDAAVAARRSRRGRQCGDRRMKPEVMSAVAAPAAAMVGPVAKARTATSRCGAWACLARACRACSATRGSIGSGWRRPPVDVLGVMKSSTPLNTTRSPSKPRISSRRPPRWRRTRRGSTVARRSTVTRFRGARATWTCSSPAPVRPAAARPSNTARIRSSSGGAYSHRRDVGGAASSTSGSQSGCTDRSTTPTTGRSGAITGGVACSARTPGQARCNARSTAVGLIPGDSHNPARIPLRVACTSHTRRRGCRVHRRTAGNSVARSCHNANVAAGVAVTGGTTSNHTACAAPCRQACRRHNTHASRAATNTTAATSNSGHCARVNCHAKPGAWAR